MNNKPYTIKQVVSNVYHVHFLPEHHFDLAMMFLPYQEYHESANPDFKGNNQLDLISYMRWYSLEKNKEENHGNFTYANDWLGFNVPGSVLEKFWDSYKVWGGQRYMRRVGASYGIYDHLMRQVLEDINCPTWNFYLIGTSEPCDHEQPISIDSTLAHEIAHGLWATNMAYGHDMRVQINSFVKSNLASYQKFFDWLSSYGYHSTVWDDELQAYFATGFVPTTEFHGNEFYEEARKPFTRIFETYLKRG